MTAQNGQSLLHLAYISVLRCYHQVNLIRYQGSPYVYDALIFKHMKIATNVCSFCTYILPVYRILVGVRFSTPVQTGPGAHTASCTMCTRYFPGVKSTGGMTLTPHPLLVPWSRKGRAIPLLPLWAVQPVQSFSACTRVHFILSCQYSIQ